MKTAMDTSFAMGVREMKIALRSMLWTLVLLVALGMWGCQETVSSGQTKDKKLKVVASIPPLRDFAEFVGMDWVEVTLLVEPGHSPHTFEPKPQHVQALSEADLILFNGLGLEPWAKDLLDVASSDAKVVFVAETAAFGELPYDNNPHLWLHPRLAKEYVRTIYDALYELYPAQAPRSVFNTNRTRLISALDQLEQEIGRTLTSIPENRRRVAVLHSAWEPLLEPYGFYILQLPTDETAFHGHAQEIPPQTLVRWAHRLQAHNIYALVLEEQHRVPELETLGGDLGIPVVYLDPLGGVEGRRTYFDMMRYNVRKLENVLKP